MHSPNIHPQEIETFEALASDWWIKDGSFKSLHDINPLRLSFITQQVDLSGKSVLDIGCGGGILSESLAHHDAKVTGIDVCASAIQIAKAHADTHHQNITYIEITAEHMAENQPAQFDIITCMELLEHVPDPTSIIQACSTLLKPGGQIFLSTLDRNLKSYLFAILGAEYLLKLLPAGLHHYDQFIRPAELAAWMRAADLDILKTAGIQYHPFSKQYRLTSNVDVNYLVYGQKRGTDLSPTTSHENP
jgi:2-polyprenyl-6-hydroxyphenyl methylase/3-demethylubiquinone-9 3-methyltransferase